MSWKPLLFLCLALAGSLSLSGCGSATIAGADEEKEPQFLIGRTRVNAMDYQGAIEAFEQALEANPRSGAAHLELGWLFAEKQSDPAAAIYHYEKYLRLRAGADNAETIRQHIFRLKQELAKGVLPIPPSTEIQRQLEQLAEDNRQLRDQVARLQAAASQVASNNRTVLPGVVGPADSGSAPQRAVGGTVPAPRTERATVTSRTHRVQAGETPVAIARRYNVKLDALLTANPELNPKRMRIGQSLVIPRR
jgi:tetratricopeptide (TPR) repeat protein